MSKKIRAFLIAILLVLQSTYPAVAADESKSASISVVSAQYRDNHMYCYVQPTDPAFDVSGVSAGVTAANSMGSEMRGLKPVSESSCMVNYMLLIDTSTSMPANHQRLVDFTDALLKEEDQETRLTIASFGMSFTVVEENLSDPEQVRQTIDQLSYTQQASDISGGVVDAVAYLADHMEIGGEICNLIILTDGDVYLAGSGTRKPDIRKSADQAKKAIGNTPEIVVHTVGFGEWESATFQALSSGTGVDLSIRNNADASKAGSSVAQFVDGLYYASIPFAINQNTNVEFIDAQIMLAIDSPGNLEFIPLNHIRNPDYVQFTSVGAPPSEGAEDDVPGGSDEDVPTEAPPEKEDSVPYDTDTVPDENVAGEKDDISDDVKTGNIDAGNEGTHTTDSETNNDEKPVGMPWALIAASAVIIVFAAVLTGMMAGRNRKRRHNHANHTEGRLWIRLELFSDNTVARRLEYPLDGNLVIGSDSSCDIALSDDTVFAQNSQIYLRDGIVYIEDITPYSNTSIGGMKIHTPNRVRDGDEVMIGRMRFRIKFLRDS